jgi:hypothetical protein
MECEAVLGIEVSVCEVWVREVSVCEVSVCTSWLTRTWALALTLSCTGGKFENKRNERPVQ